MAKTKGAEPLTEKQFLYEVAGRVGSDFISPAILKRSAAEGTVSPGDRETILRAALTAIKDEIVDCVVQGYKVNLTGLASFEGVVKPGRPKGTVIRNPFDPDAKEKKLKADEPDKFAVKVSKSSAITGKFPTLKSKDGQELHAKLYVKPKRKKK